LLVQRLNLLLKVLQVSSGDARSSDLPYKPALFSLQSLHHFFQGLNGHVAVHNLLHASLLESLRHVVTLLKGRSIAEPERKKYTKKDKRTESKQMETHYTLLL
jgi:hypothetical protein